MDSSYRNIDKGIVHYREDGVQFMKESNLSSNQNPVQYLLNTKIKEYGKSVLSNDLNTATTILQGKFLLQVCMIMIINPYRLLMFQMQVLHRLIKLVRCFHVC